MSFALAMTAISAACLWGGAAIYILAKPTSINPVPWIVWSAACLIAAVNTAVEEGFSGQALVFAGSGIFFLAVVLRRIRVLVWRTLPSWQKIALPLLIASPVVTVWTSPLAGILLQSVFGWVTAAAFIQTAASGLSRDPISAWWIQLLGCVSLLLANDFVTWSWVLPLNSSLLTAACLSAIYLGKSRPARGGLNE